MSTWYNNMLGQSMTTASLDPEVHTFKCPHMQIGNVSSARCGECGDLEPVDRV